MDLFNRDSAATSLDSEAENTYELGDLLLDYLKQLGVQFIFGIPGGAIEPLYNALARSERRGGIKSIVARHETGAGFMCDGYYFNSGILGVCCATTGPGTTNLITSCASAFANQIPILFITAQTALNTFGKGAFQESSSSETGVDTLKLFENITNFNSMVTHVDQFEQILTTALRKAFISPKGPVHISIPMDVFRSVAPVQTPSFDLSMIRRPSTLIDQISVDKLSDILTSGYKIVFVVGDGCAQAIHEIIEVATLLNIQIVTTPHGKGLISPYHPLHRGVIGFAGHETAYQVTHDDSVRFIIAIGARFGEWDSNGWDKTLLSEKLIHVSSDSGFFNRTPMAKLHVLGNISSIFNRILDYLGETSFTDVNAIKPALVAQTTGQTGRPTRFFKLNDNDAYNDDSVPIKPQRLMKLLPRLFPYNTHYLSDVGNSMAWAIHYLHNFKSSRSRDLRLAEKNAWSGFFRTCLEFSSMGWAIGASIGTSFACPEDPVICITGDGAMLMSGQEITVALQHNLSVIFVVLNDSSLGMVKHGQKLTGAEQTSVDLPDISFARMARAMGIDAYTIRSPQDMLELDIDQIINNKSPTLLDVLIDKNEIPPIGLRTDAIKKQSKEVT
jgi:acetolactate synthase-1/2/3 large subunit